MSTTTARYVDGLRQALLDPVEAAAYLDAALAEGDMDGFLLALRDVAEARGMTQAAPRPGSIAKTCTVCWHPMATHNCRASMRYSIASACDSPWRSALPLCADAILVQARRTLPASPTTFAPRGGFVHGLGRSLGGGGRAYAPTPPLRCAIPPTPWRSAGERPRLAAGQPFPASAVGAMISQVDSLGSPATSAEFQCNNRQARHGHDVHGLSKA